MPTAVDLALDPDAISGPLQTTLIKSRASFHLYPVLTYYQSFSKFILLFNIIKHKMLRENTVLSHPVRNSRLVVEGEEWEEEELEDNRLSYPG